MKTRKLKSDSSALRIPLTIWLLALGGGIFSSLASIASAQTIISGPTISGTWSPSGNPYIVTGNCTVPANQTLTIQPGVVVEIGSNVTITANSSLIQADGTPSQRITIKAASSSYYFSSILLENPSGNTQSFMYCDFANAQVAIDMYVDGGNQVMPVNIMNCTFSNCVQEAIYGNAIGTGGNDLGYPPYAASATINPVVKNCVFNATGNGCVLNMSGNGGYAGYYPGYGYSYPTIVANIFQNLSGSAFLMQAGSYAGGGSPVFQNNTVVNCGGGVNATDPWNVLVQDNIFVGCTNAITDTATLTRTVSYNAFYENATNFTGYSGIYGQVLFNNFNGTPCDLLNNIYQNPLFVATNNFQLQTNSPCINAGLPGQAYDNMCFPPSIGTTNGDMGAYGGPDACNWLTDVPLLPVSNSISMNSNNVVSIFFGAIPRSTYQLQSVTNLPSTNWVNLANSLVLAAQYSNSVVIVTNPTAPRQFFRTQSLGRTPGN